MDLHSDGGEGSSIEEDIRDELSTYRYKQWERGCIATIQNPLNILFTEATVCRKSQNLVV